jgi:hypothetical protein
MEQNLVVLDDVDPNSVSSEQWGVLLKLVSEQGGSIVIIPGDPARLSEMARHPVAGQLLPLLQSNGAEWRIWPGEEPFYRLAPAPGAENLEALKLAADAETSRRRWGELPAMFRVVIASDVKPNVRPLLIERDSGGWVLTESRIGLGRALFFGAHETWRWRAKVGERDQDRLWLQLLRYVSEEPYAIHEQTLYFDADRVQIEPGQPVHLRARIGTESKASPRIQVATQGRGVREIPMIASPSPGRFEATVSDLPSGAYDLKLASNGTIMQASLPLQVAQSNEQEMADLAGDEALLRRIAGASGGEMLRLSQLKDLPGKLRAVYQSQSNIAEYRLWDSPYLFGLVLGCLGTEWALRKRFGLA